MEKEALKLAQID